MVLHTVIIFYQVELPERKKPIRKPISVKFVQRAPRLSKALELMKRPVVVQRQLTRKITRPKSVIPRTIRTSAVHGGTALASLAKPGEAVERSLAPQRLELGPEIIAGDVENVKELEDPHFIPILRWERIWFNDFVKGFDFADSRITSLDTEDTSQERLSLGLSFRLMPSVVFSAVWEHNRLLNGSNLIFPRPVGTDPIPNARFDSFLLGTSFGF